MTNAKPILGQHALDGVKVIDLTRVLGGPYATQILADHGADIIKIESAAGDEVRGWGPPFAREMASYFINVNRNKKIGCDRPCQRARARSSATAS